MKLVLFSLFLTCCVAAPAQLSIGKLQLNTVRYSTPDTEWFINYGQKEDLFTYQNRYWRYSFGINKAHDSLTSPYELVNKNIEIDHHLPCVIDTAGSNLWTFGVIDVQFTGEYSLYKQELGSIIETGHLTNGQLNGTVVRGSYEDTASILRYKDNKLEGLQQCYFGQKEVKEEAFIENHQVKWEKKYYSTGELQYFQEFFPKQRTAIYHFQSKQICSFEVQDSIRLIYSRDGRLVSRYTKSENHPYWEHIRYGKSGEVISSQKCDSFQYVGLVPPILYTVYTSQSPVFRTENCYVSNRSQSLFMQNPPPRFDIEGAVARDQALISKTITRTFTKKDIRKTGMVDMQLVVAISSTGQVEVSSPTPLPTDVLDRLAKNLNDSKISFPNNTNTIIGNAIYVFLLDLKK